VNAGQYIDWTYPLYTGLARIFHQYLREGYSERFLGGIRSLVVPSKEPLNKSFFLSMKTDWGRFLSHRLEKLGFWLMDPR
jgi:hypothetical protein